MGVVARVGLCISESMALTHLLILSMSFGTTPVGMGGSTSFFSKDPDGKPERSKVHSGCCSIAVDVETGAEDICSVAVTVGVIPKGINSL